LGGKKYTKYNNINNNLENFRGARLLLRGAYKSLVAVLLKCSALISQSTTNLMAINKKMVIGHD